MTRDLGMTKERVTSIEFREKIVRHPERSVAQLKDLEARHKIPRQARNDKGSRNDKGASFGFELGFNTECLRG